MKVYFLILFFTTTITSKVNHVRDVLEIGGIDGFQKVREKEFDVGNVDLNENEQYIQDLCEIPNLCSSEDEVFELPVDAELTSYQNVDGEVFYKYKDENREFSLTLDEDENVIGGEFHDPQLKTKDSFIRTKTSGLFLLTRETDAELGQIELEAPNDAFDREKMCEENPDICEISEQAALNLHETLSRRRLLEGKTWYSLKIVYTQTVADRANEKNLDLQDISNDLVGLTNTGYSNSKLNIEAHLLRYEVFPFKDLSKGKNCISDLIRNEVTSVFDYVYDGDCRKSGLLSMSRGTLTLEECEKACLEKASCTGISLTGFLNDKTNVGKCTSYAQGRGKWLKPKYGTDGDTKCYSRTSTYKQETDVTVFVLNNKVECNPAKRWLGYQTSVWAFVNWSNLKSLYTFAHEVGHVIGLQHNDGARATCRSSRYNCGYVPKCFVSNQERGMRTIMSYGTAQIDPRKTRCKKMGMERRVNYYSSPDLKIQDEDDGKMYVAGTKQANNRQKILDEIEDFRDHLTTADACASNPCGRGKCEAREGHQYRCNGRGSWKGGDGKDLGVRWVAQKWSKCSKDCDIGTQSTPGFNCMDGNDVVSDDKCVYEAPPTRRRCYQHLDCEVAKSMGRSNGSNPAPIPTKKPSKKPPSPKPSPSTKPSKRPSPSKKPTKKPSPKPSSKKPSKKPSPPSKKPSPDDAIAKCKEELTKVEKELKKCEDSKTPTNPNCVCITLYSPVCGVDGKTYSNSCKARCAKVKVDYNGECSKRTGGSTKYTKKTKLFCRSRKNNFKNLEDAQAACSLDRYCSGVLHPKCKGTSFQLCKTNGSFSKSSIGSCIYEKNSKSYSEAKVGSPTDWISDNEYEAEVGGTKNSCTYSLRMAKYKLEKCNAGANPTKRPSKKPSMKLTKKPSMKLTNGAWKKKSNRYCNYRNNRKYKTLEEAQKAVARDPTKNTIYDRGCTGKDFQICGSSAKWYTSKSSCLYTTKVSMEVEVGDTDVDYEFEGNFEETSSAMHNVFVFLAGVVVAGIVLKAKSSKCGQKSETADEYAKLIEEL